MKNRSSEEAVKEKCYKGGRYIKKLWNGFVQVILSPFSHGGPSAMIFFISCYYHLFSAWNRLKIRQLSGMVRELLHLTCDHVQIVAFYCRCSVRGRFEPIVSFIDNIFSLSFILFVFHMTHLHWLSFLKCTWFNYLPLSALQYHFRIAV